MTVLQNKIDFMAFIKVEKANPNGDPASGNRPRVDFRGYGEMTDVCIKRKIRNRLQDMGEAIFEQSDDRSDDGFKSLSERAENNLDKNLEEEEFKKKACELWTDVRLFGQVFAYKSKNVRTTNVRGPVSVHHAVSVSPVDVRTISIVKSMNGDPKDGRGPERMGSKHFVDFGIYCIKGAVNVQLAEKTGVTEGDVEKLKEALRTLFINDASSARPEGSMEVIEVIWWRHNNKNGQYSSAKVHRSVSVKVKEGVAIPSSIDDYDITIAPLEGLTPEIIPGI